ncbi:MAG: shikimate kinase [Rhizobiaceae bacterium]|nr:shikimate kinase [Rhizobiaceae bacterium]
MIGEGKIGASKLAAVSESKLKEAGEAARLALGDRNLVLVGLMGAGKSVIGKLLAQYTGLPFVDTDDEIVAAAQMPITEIFAQYGEPEFRALESRVVKRVLQEGPQIVSTGGGAFMNDETRENILQSALSLWLNADYDVLWARVSKRSTRPLLQQPNPQKILRDLMDERYPIYRLADISVKSRNAPKQNVAFDAVKMIEKSGDIIATKQKVTI